MPVLLFGSESWYLTDTSLEKLENFQCKYIPLLLFHLPVRWILSGNQSFFSVQGHFAVHFFGSSAVVEVDTALPEQEPQQAWNWKATSADAWNSPIDAVIFLMMQNRHPCQWRTIAAVAYPGGGALGAPAPPLRNMQNLVARMTRLTEATWYLRASVKTGVAQPRKHRTRAGSSKCKSSRRRIC